MIKKNIEKRLSRITSLKTDNKIENNTISYDNILQFISIGKFQKALTCIIETAHNTNIANEFTSTLLMGLLNLKIKNTNEYIIYLTKLNTFSKKDKTVIIPHSYMHVIIETLKLFDINDIIKETKRTFHNLYLCYLMVGVAYLDNDNKVTTITNNNNNKVIKSILIKAIENELCSCNNSNSNNNNSTTNKNNNYNSNNINNDSFKYPCNICVIIRQINLMFFERTFIKDNVVIYKKHTISIKNNNCDKAKNFAIRYHLDDKVNNQSLKKKCVFQTYITCIGKNNMKQLNKKNKKLIQKNIPLINEWDGVDTFSTSVRDIVSLEHKSNNHLKNGICFNNNSNNSNNCSSSNNNIIIQNKCSIKTLPSSKLNQNRVLHVASSGSMDIRRYMSSISFNIKTLEKNFQNFQSVTNDIRKQLLTMSANYK